MLEVVTLSARRLRRVASWAKSGRQLGGQRLQLHVTKMENQPQRTTAPSETQKLEYVYVSWRKATTSSGNLTSEAIVAFGGAERWDQLLLLSASMHACLSRLRRRSKWGEYAYGPTPGGVFTQSSGPGIMPVRYSRCQPL